MATDERAIAEFSRRASGEYRHIPLDHGAFAGTRDHPVTPEFYRLFQMIAAHSGEVTTEAQRNELQAPLLDVKLTPHVMDFYSALVARFLGTPHKPKFVMVAEHLSDPHFEDAWDRLSSPTISFELKLNAMESRIDGVVAGYRAFDKRDYDTMRRIFE